MTDKVGWDDIIRQGKATEKAAAMSDELFEDSKEALAEAYDIPVESLVAKRNEIVAERKKKEELKKSFHAAIKEGAEKDRLEAIKGDIRTASDVQQTLSELLDTKPKEINKKDAENILWDFIQNNSKVFCCGGVGYFLMNEGDGVPVAVTRDGQDFNRFLISVGIHPGSPMRDRIGKFIGTKCFYEGVKTEVRLGFHFEPRNFAAYIACSKGKLIRIDSGGFEEVPNGTDNQLFIFPDSWQPLLTKPLDELGAEINSESDFPKSDLIVRGLFPDGYLVNHLFGGTNFEIQSMDEKQIRILLVAYLLFLMMPGIVSERVMLQTLGPSGSGKTYLLDYFGHLLVGPSFTVRPLPNDVREFENQVINEYFIAYDNVSSIPREIKDRFCQAVTGLEVVRRELFTTSQEARSKSKATISLSAIHPPLPELEHQNRTITINFNERENSFVAKEELFKVLDANRDDIILNLIRRMSLVLGALWEQRHYVPKVNLRLSSVATFILRIAKHEGWESEAQNLLDAWADEQSTPTDDDDVETALTRWIGRDDWVSGVELTATVLNERLKMVMSVNSASENNNLSWQGKHLVLAKIISRNLKTYASRFGLKRIKARGKAHTYQFVPTPARLAEIKAGLNRQPFESKK
jgi:hypothetical protein